eukprot:403335542
MEDNSDQGFTQDFDFNNGLSFKIRSQSSIKEGGGTIWDAAYVLVHFFMKHPHGMLDFMSLDPSQEYLMIELGSGTGIAGIGYAKLFSKSRCILTEYSESSIKLMQANIQENELDQNLVSTYNLEWGKEQAKKLKNDLQVGDEHLKIVDLIIGSDVVYLAKQFDDLIQCMLELGTKGHTRILFGATEHGNFKLFQQKLIEYREQIKVTYVPSEFLDETYRDDDINVFIMDLI